VRWEQAIRKDLIPVEDRGTYYAEHEMAALLRGDSTGRANFYRTMSNIGALSINEIREFENMNPVPGGDEHFIPLNVGTVDDVANPEPPANVQPFPAKGASNG
jgi:phage portal protein BeeE